MIVVTDASPISALAAIGQLDLLRQLYCSVVLPPTVHEEVMAGPAASIVASASEWLSVVTPNNGDVVAELAETLDEGESEAIALALELAADVLLMDERLGRREARRRGMRVVGVVGVLVEARQGKMVSALAPLLDDLVARSSFRISTALRERALHDVGESTPK